MSGMWRNGEPAPRERLFFALMPDQREAFRISAWAEAGLGAGWNFVRADRQHMTLCITNDYERPPFELHEKLFRAGDMVAASPVAVELAQLAVGGERAMLRPRHVNAPLKALQRAIAEAMAAMGAPMRAGWRFAPHLTLGFAARETTGRAAQPPRPISAFGWQACEFVLVRSLIGQTRHLILRRWPLIAAPSPQYELF